MMTWEALLRQGRDMNGPHEGCPLPVHSAARAFADATWWYTALGHPKPPEYFLCELNKNLKVKKLNNYVNYF